MAKKKPPSHERKKEAVLAELKRKRLSLKEISAKFGVPVGTIKSWQQRERRAAEPPVDLPDIQGVISATSTPYDIMCAVLAAWASRFVRMRKTGGNRESAAFVTSITAAIISLDERRLTSSVGNTRAQSLATLREAAASMDDAERDQFIELLRKMGGGPPIELGYDPARLGDPAIEEVYNEQDHK